MPQFIIQHQGQESATHWRCCLLVAYAKCVQMHTRYMYNVILYFIQLYVHVHVVQYQNNFKPAIGSGW